MFQHQLFRGDGVNQDVLVKFLPQGVEVLSDGEEKQLIGAQRLSHLLQDC